jgi:Helix-turn-helix domain
VTHKNSSNLPFKRQTTHWLQTDRATHEAWAKLSVRSPRASALLHLLAARVGEHNAVVISQTLLAKMMGCNRRTIIRAVDDLVQGNWIELRQIGDRGTINAYIVNSRVIWHGSREKLRYALFSAQVIISEDEQPDRGALDNQPPLNQLPRIFSDERQHPAGDGLPPPSQPFFEGFEPDLPAIEIGYSSDESAAAAQLITDFASKLRIVDETES